MPLRMIGAAALIIATQAGCGSPAPGAEALEFVVSAGATWDGTVSRLVDQGIVRHRRWFDAVARLRGVPGNLKSGVYAFRPNEAYGTLFAALTVGRSRETRLVIREGLMLGEIADEVQRTLKIPRDSLITAAADRTLLVEFGIDAMSAEGYLYPDTYHVPEGIQARDVVRLLAREFTRRWDPAWNERLDSLDLTRHELVTLASVIEGETQIDIERAFVSGVYHNRLRRGMPLQADPTVIYALQERRRLFERDYRVDHPYNTYRIRGLPPGPIGSPSAGSLYAALYPAEVPYLFFVAGPGGLHIFSETYAEHERARRFVMSQR